MVGKLRIDIAASGKRLFEGIGDFLAHKMKANGTTSKQVDAKLEGLEGFFAERGGFEPPVALQPHALSKRTH